MTERTIQFIRTKLRLPLTRPGFELVLPHISPPAQSALYNAERFLALMV